MASWGPGEKATFEFYVPPSWFGPEQKARRFASTRAKQTRKPDDFAMPHFHRDAALGSDI